MTWFRRRLCKREDSQSSTSFKAKINGCKYDVEAVPLVFFGDVLRHWSRSSPRPGGRVEKRRPRAARGGLSRPLHLSPATAPHPRPLGSGGGGRRRGGRRRRGGGAAGRSACGGEGGGERRRRVLGTVPPRNLLRRKRGAAWPCLRRAVLGLPSVPAGESTGPFVLSG